MQNSIDNHKLISGNVNMPASNNKINSATSFLIMINEVASLIDEEWKKCDYSCYKFPDVVMRKTGSYNFADEFKFSDIITMLQDTNVRNVQIVSEFSDLHFKLFDNGKFYIEILNWWNRDTSIHDHGFSGVLFQLSGTGFNAIYTYEEEECISQHLRVGKIGLSTVQLSQKGDVRVIPSGREEKHAVLHIEQPTISLIIRTHPVIDLSPQLNYFPPYLLMDHSAIDNVFNKEIKFFQLLFLQNQELAKSKILEAMGAASMTQCFWYLMKLSNIILSPSHIDMLSIFINQSNTDSERKLKEKLITSTVARKSSQYIIDEVKPLFQDRSTRLFLAGLAASYNIQEKQKIFSILNIDYDLSRITSIKNQLPEGVKNKFLTAVDILSK